MSAPTRPRARRGLGRDFRLVWSAVVISSTGDGMFITAFPLLAARLTSDPILIAGVTVAQRLPWLVASLFMGALADRFDRRRLMVIADVVRCAVVGLFGLGVVVGWVDIWSLYACAFLLTVGETLHVSAGQAVLPAIVEPADLLQANSRFGIAQISSAQFVGPPLGAATFTLSASVPFLADAVTFAGSAALIGALPDEHGVTAPSTRFRDDMREGLAFAWSNRAVRRITVILAVINVFYFAATSLLVLYTKQRLHAGSAVYSAMFVSAGLGTILTRVYLGALVRRLGEIRAMALSFWFWTVPIIVLALTSTTWVAVSSYFLLGTGTGLWIALNTTIRQRLTPPRLLGRMSAVFRFVSWGVVPFGAALGGVLARAFSLTTPFFIGGAAMLPIGLFGRRLLRPVERALAEQ
jgi:MFS family permease